MPQTLDQLNAEIESLQTRLNTGVTELAAGGRMMKRDLKMMRERLTTLERQRDALAGTPMVRQIRTFSTRGY